MNGSRPSAPVAAPRVAVVGGGLAGLVAADRLLGAGLSVVVFEKYPEAGGLVGTFEVGGTLIRLVQAKPPKVKVPKRRCLGSGQ